MPENQVKKSQSHVVSLFLPLLRGKGVTFIEAISVVTATIALVTIMAATIAQASVTWSQGGSSNLQRLKAHHPLTFKGGGDPMVVDHWFCQIRKIVEGMKITSDAARIKLAAF